MPGTIDTLSVDLILNDAAFKAKANSLSKEIESLSGKTQRATKENDKLNKSHTQTAKLLDKLSLKAKDYGIGLSKAFLPAMGATAVAGAVNSSIEASKKRGEGLMPLEYASNYNKETFKDIYGLREELKKGGANLPDEKLTNVVSDVQEYFGDLSRNEKSDLAKRFVFLEQNGIDTSSIIPEYARSRTLFGIENEDLATNLDTVYSASRDAKVGIGDLISTMNDFKSTNRQSTSTVLDLATALDEGTKRGKTLSQTAEGLGEELEWINKGTQQANYRQHKPLYGNLNASQTGEAFASVFGSSYNDTRDYIASHPYNMVYQPLSVESAKAHLGKTEGGQRDELWANIGDTIDTWLNEGILRRHMNAETLEWESTNDYLHNSGKYGQYLGKAPIPYEARFRGGSTNNYYFGAEVDPQIVLTRNNEYDRRVDGVTLV